jgi:hypothetical protein
MPAALWEFFRPPASFARATGFVNARYEPGPAPFPAEVAGAVNSVPAFRERPAEVPTTPRQVFDRAGTNR